MEETIKKKNNSFTYVFKDNAFSPDDAAKGILLFLVFETAISLVYQTVYGLGINGTFLSYFFNVILDACFVLTVVIVAKNRNNEPFSQLHVKKAPNIVQILLCIATSLVCIFGFSSLTNCFLQVLYNLGYSSLSSDMVISTIGDYLIYVAFVCILPAVCEEILFRGLIFTGLKKISTAVGVFGSAFLFMIMHGSPDQTVHQFILGIVLALAFLVTNNLWVPILIHFFNNFIAVTYAFIAYGDSASTEVEVTEIYLSQYFIYAIISSVIAGSLIYLIIKMFANINAKKSKQEESSKYGEHGTIGAEVEYRILESTQNENIAPNFSYDFEPNYTNVEVASETPIMNNTNKFTRQGKFIMIISVVWLALDWVLALIQGFLI